MPTKRNKAGQQQNYVPAGHGDASGEYGDNATGSNIHIKFENFKKPEPPKETRSKELSAKQIKEIGNYVISRKGFLDADSTYIDRLIRNLRYYNGSFGDLSGFSDEELKAIVEEFATLPTSEDMLWYKKGSKWVGTRNKGLLEKAGIKYYTSQEKDAKIKEDNIKLVEKSQTASDKELQNVLGENSVVCFGKQYDANDMKQIIEDTKKYVEDFPELKDTIKMMGDRNNLEKYINAVRSMQEFSEEEIANEMARLRKIGYTASDEKLKEKAISSLQQPVKFTQHNRAYAYWSPNKSAMIYMGKMKNFTSEEQERNYKLNWHSSNKTNSVFCHELGHSVDSAIEKMNEKISNYFKNNNNIENFDKNNKFYYDKQEFYKKINELSKQNYNPEYKQKLNEYFKEKTGKDYDVTQRSYSREFYEAEKYAKEKLANEGIKKYSISEYGNTNTQEFVAECFSAYYTGMNNPLATQVVGLYKEYAKKIRENYL